MLTWQSAPKLRNDDPYHAFAYHRARARGEATDGKCHVVVELPVADTQAAMLAAFDALLAAISQSSDVVASGDETAHIGSARAAWDADFLTWSTRPARETAYARMFILLMPEDALFSADESAPSGWWMDRANMRYIGQPVRSLGAAVANTDRVQSDTSVDVDLAIIDDSIAFLNQAFVDRGETLLRNVWMQDVAMDAPAGSLGTRLNKVTIDALLAKVLNAALPDTERSVYQGAGQALDFASDRYQPLAFGVSHGTHVASTAVRSFVEQGGVLSGLGLHAVTLPVAVTNDTSGATLGPYLLAALRQCMLWSDQRGHRLTAPVPPLVMSCSYGYLAGLKDGSDPLISVISELIFSRNALGRETALVLPMGNAYFSRTVAKLDLPPGTSKEFDLVLWPDDRTPSYLDLFGATEGAGDQLSLEISITPPHLVDALQVEAGAAPVDQHMIVTADDGDLLSQWSETVLPDASDFAFRGTLAVAPTTDLARPLGVVPHGYWRVRVHNASASQTVNLWAFVQSDDAPGGYPEFGRQAFLETLGSHELDSGPHYHASFDHDGLGGPDSLVTHARTASVLAAIESQYIFVTGAGEGAYGDVASVPVRPSEYTSAGARVAAFEDTVLGPDLTELADRSDDFRGIFGAATYSGNDVLMAGTSVAAPQTAARIAVALTTTDEALAGLKAYFEANSRNDDPLISPVDARFGLVVDTLRVEGVSA